MFHFCSIIEICRRKGVSHAKAPRLRGRGSGENVFYMLNGKYSTKVEIEKLNPDDILSINILKGKNATDKYGSLGKNGVIEIHTKVF